MTGYNRRGRSRHAGGGPGQGRSRRDRTTWVRSMNHCPSTEQLRQLLADALPDADAVEAHAADCVACQQVLERLASEVAVPSEAIAEPLTLAPPGPGEDEAFLRRLEAAPPWAGPTEAHEPVPGRDGEVRGRPRRTDSDIHDTLAPAPLAARPRRRNPFRACGSP